MKTLTVEDILAGARYSVEHPKTYDQKIWCGTSCCVLGRARELAGSDAIEQGLQEGEIIDSTPRGRMLQSMLYWGHGDTAALMPHVGDDGVLRLPAGGIGSFGAGARIGVGARIGDGARIEEWGN
jgi:hypothetical protein